MQPFQGSRRASLAAGPFTLSETEHPAGLHLSRHAHRAACFHLVLGGVYQESTARGGLRLGAGAMLFKPAGEPHWNRFEDGQGGARTLRVELAAADGLRLPPLGPGQSADPVLRALARRLTDELRHPDACSALAVEGLCLELVARLGRAQAAAHGAGRAAARELARRAARLLEERYREPLRLGALARELGVHRSRLARAFRQEERCTMGEYVRLLRVEHVRRALRTTRRPLAAIAAEAGFADQSHCTRVFQRVVGVPPGAYRAG